MNIKNFEKWGMNPMSYSRLASFRNYPTQFIINKIYKYNIPPSPAMRTGHFVEELLYQKLKGETPAMDKALLDFEEQMQDYHDQDQVQKYLKLIPKFYDNCEGLFKKMGNYPIHSYQEELHTSILGVNFLGFSDFVFDLGDELLVYDLKTKGRMAVNHSDKLQQWIYKKALEEKYQKKVSCHLYIVTPSKHHFEEIVFDDSHEIEINNLLKGLDKVLHFCNSKEDFALLYQPNKDDFIWNSPEMIKARGEIWGI